MSALNVNELRAHLDALVKADPRHGALVVTFGEDTTPVAGGIVRIGRLALAPIKLDLVGGF